MTVTVTVIATETVTAWASASTVAALVVVAAGATMRTGRGGAAAAATTGARTSDLGGGWEGGMVAASAVTAAAAATVATAVTVAASETGSGTETATVIATATAGVMGGSTVAPRAAGTGGEVEGGVSPSATDWVAGKARRDAMGRRTTTRQVSKPLLLGERMGEVGIAVGNSHKQYEGSMVIALRGDTRGNTTEEKDKKGVVDVRTTKKGKGDKETRGPYTNRLATPPTPQPSPLKPPVVL